MGGARRPFPPVPGGIFVPESALLTWQALRSRLQAIIPADSYDTWFNRLSVMDWEGGVLQLSAPNRYVKLWIESHYKNELLSAARTIQPETHTVELTVTSQVLRVPAASATPVSQVLNALPTPATREQSEPAPRLSPAYRLDGFVVGSHNRLAQAACLTVVETPATIYNPLLIHGDHGLGKTHLIQALSHALHERHPNLRVRVVSTEEFANAYVQAVQSRKIEAFRAEFRRCHALVVDDVQFLSGKEKTQDEFLHTFDTLRHLGRQIVLSSDVHPREIKNLDPRLAERFVSGLVARLAPPDFNTRVELIRTKALARRLTLAPALCEILASRVERSVRELEGVVCKLGALSAAECRAPDKEMVLLALRELGYLREGPLTLEDILATVVQRAGQDADEIRSARRHASLVRTRHIAMYLCKQLTSLSLGEIGRFFGNRDHSTVLHAVRKLTEDLKQDEDLHQEILTLRRMLGR